MANIRSVNRRHKRAVIALQARNNGVALQAPNKLAQETARETPQPAKVAS